MVQQDWVEDIKADLAAHERKQRARRSDEFQDTMSELGISVPAGCLKWSDGHYLFTADIDDTYHLVALRRVDALQVIAEAWDVPSLSEHIINEIIRENTGSPEWRLATDALHIYYFPKGASWPPFRLDAARAITKIEKALEFLAKQRWEYDRLYRRDTTQEST